MDVSETGALEARHREAMRRLLELESELAGTLARARAAEREIGVARAASADAVRNREALDEELARLRRELDRRNDELARCSTALRSVVESASWRLTRPLRRLTGSTRPERA